MGALGVAVLGVLSVLCILALFRVSEIEKVNQAQTVDSQPRRRLTEAKANAENPFMDGVCLDFIQDNTLQVSVTKFSVVIVARNEDRSALLRTVKSVIENSQYTNSAVGVANKITLGSVVVVDDYSYTPITSWEEWATLKSEAPIAAKLLKIVRLNKHSGTATAKNRGAEEAHALVSLPSTGVSPSEHALIFLDAHAIVSPYWLVPLASSLSRHPQALVYPVLDILTTTTPASGGEAPEVGVIRAEDHLVMGFDWALRPRWEPLQLHGQQGEERVRVAPHSLEAGAVEVLSPAVPGIFAVREQFFNEIGKFDATQRNAYATPAETVELSLRAWLCGGVVIKQSCSRVAHHSANLFSEAPMGQGVTQAAVDTAVLNVAQKWLQGTAALPASHSDQRVSYQELTFRARFLGRVPYAVETANDPIMITPPQSTKHTLSPTTVTLSTNSGDTLKVCLPFEWYLQKVYPGLLADAPGVLDQFAAYLSTDYLKAQKPIQAQLAEYNKPAEQQRTHEMQTGLLSVRAGKLEKLFTAAVGAGIPSGSATGPLALKRFFPTPPGPKPLTRAELLADHDNQVRENLLCEDFPEKVYADSCEAKLAADPELCTLRKGAILFQCPKTCNYCAKEDGTFCEDFYLNKCKTWAAEGKCGQRIADYGLTTEVCRKSCQVCTPMYMAGSNTAGAGAGTGAAKPAAPLAVAAGAGMVEPPKEGLDADGKRHIVLKVRKDALPKPEKSKLVQSTDPNLPPPPKIPEMTEKEIEMLRVDLMISKPMTVDPEFLQKEFRAGRVPDYKDGGGAVVTENNLCEPVDHADAQLLSRITVASSEGSSLNVDADGKDLRIFCGIYTMEANHETNVKATRNTWAKKCDGFIAFSTKEDATIPSVAIMHEGKEAYDNMWQKSRSIWKYVYTHLRDKYDYFLLGGDDMFYIVENLRAYLGSEEITTQRKEREGLFIGRIFQPPNQIIFNSGGAGYLLDTKALTTLGKNIDSPKCFPHQVGFWEDVNVANCLKKSTPSIVPYDTRDPLLRERFHPFNPGLQLSYRIPPNPDWYAKYNPNLKVGFECCSDGSISFHYVKEKLLYRLYNYLYHCDNKITA